MSHVMHKIRHYRCGRAATRGFTLIELMVVVLILSILVGVAYPSYTRYIIDSRRADGQRFLLQAAGAQEKFYTQCGYYASSFGAGAAGNVCGAAAGAGQLSMDSTSIEIPTYSLTVNPGPTGNIATSFLLTAVPSGSQTDDTDCMNLTINSQGFKSQSGPNASNRCWRR